MMSKKTLGICLAFVVICVGVITYIQIDKHNTERAVQQKIEEQNKKEVQAIDDYLKKGDPLKKALDKKQ